MPEIPCDNRDSFHKHETPSSLFPRLAARCTHPTNNRQCCQLSIVDALGTTISMRYVYSIGCDTSNTVNLRKVIYSRCILLFLGTSPQDGTSLSNLVRISGLVSSISVSREMFIFCNRFYRRTGWKASGSRSCVLHASICPTA